MNEKFCPSEITPDQGTFRIDLQNWFFENQSLGYAIGMICHEIAAHPMSSHYVKNVQRPWPAHTASYNILPDGQYVVQPNAHIIQESLKEKTFKDRDHIVRILNSQNVFPTESANLAGMDVRLPEQSNDIRIDPQTANQTDHAFACSPGTTRYAIYQSFVMHIARLMVIDGHAARDIHDLFECYLMDVASILVTHDTRSPFKATAGRLRGFTEIARIFNLRKSELIQKAQASKRCARILVNAMPANKNSWDIARMYRSTLWKFLGTFGPGFSHT